MAGNGKTALVEERGWGTWVEYESTRGVVGMPIQHREMSASGVTQRW